MTRYILSKEAREDLEDLRVYVNRLYPEPARRIGLSIQKMLAEIGTCPDAGTSHSTLSRLSGVEVRSRLVAPYRIFYTTGGSMPQILAILHGARDIKSIMLNRIH